MDKTKRSLAENGLIISKKCGIAGARHAESIDGFGSYPDLVIDPFCAKNRKCGT
jgi:hypothetical protein